MAWIAAALVFASTTLILENTQRIPAESEPDQSFHLALGRQMAEQGLVRTLPQADQVPWKDRFTNSYFLFTALTAVGWKVAGEAGALAVVPLLTVCLLLLLFAIGRRYLPWGVALALPLLLLMNSTSLTRLISLRPSLLAACCMVGLCLAFLQKNRWAVGLCCAAFALSYHSLFFPLGLLAVAGALGVLFENGWTRLAVIGCAGLVGGMLIHPYFPQTLFLMLEVTKHVLTPSPIPFSESPMEIHGWTKELFFSRLPFFSVVLGIGSWMVLAGKKGKSKSGSTTDPEFLFLFSLAFGFAGLVFVSFRAIEYAGPFCVAFSAILIARLAKEKWHAPALVAIAGLLSLPEGAHLFYKPLGVFVEPVALRNAIEALPAEAKGQKVYNCDWFVGGPVLYGRPDMKFVDLGDPRAIDATAPGFSILKAQLRSAQVPYIWGPIRHAFTSDYVLCQGSPLVEAMDASPFFRRLYPPLNEQPSPVPETVFTVHEVRKDPLPNFVTHFERLEKGNWTVVEGNPALKPEQRSPFQNLTREPAAFRELASAGLACVTMRPTRAEIARLAGAEYLGVGGGPHVLVQLNGKSLFARQHRVEFEALDAFVPLPRALNAKDTLTVQTCRSTNSDRLGVALSFWKQDQFRDICKWKGMPAQGPTMGGAAFSDKPTFNCLATFAAKNGLHP